MAKRYPVKLFSGKTLMLNADAYELYRKMGMHEFADLIKKSR